MSAPTLTREHDTAVVGRRVAVLVQAFGSMLINERVVANLGGPVHAAVQRMHLENVAIFGWRDAELVRCHAFQVASANLIPVGEASESDFGEFMEEALAP